MPATPAVIAHADWGTEANKRWIALAVLDESGVYRVSGPQAVGDPGTLLRRLFEMAGSAGSVFAGFDFPIVVPARYAELAGIDSFPQVLTELGTGRWLEFYRAANTPAEISLRRPFYPNRYAKKGEQTQAQLYGALGLESMDGLFRTCDRATATRRAACCMFWTLGGNQVGKAAISGWEQLVAPALRDRQLPIALWPFDGELESLLEALQVVVAETYPTEFYGHLGIRLVGSKRQQEGRSGAMPALRAWLERDDVADRVRLEPTAEGALASAFGVRADGEDQFDAFVGLIGMLNIVLGRRSPGEPARDSPQRSVEGWILGQDAQPASHTLFS